jgi:phosphoribosylglycinamide formyltransferase-1
MASGGGTNLQALIDASVRGDLSAKIALVVSNNSKSGALQRARDSNIAGVHISSKTHGDPDAALLAALAEHGCKLVVLAGYMKKLPLSLIEAFPGRIVNIHPAPLPRFGGQGMFGDHVHERVLSAGVDSSGPTVHVVTAEYDEGPTLAHRTVAVRADDKVATLKARIQAAEHDLYWRVIENEFCS